MKKPPAASILLVILTSLVASPIQARHYKVFLLGGQSNMFGFSTARTSLPSELQAPQEDVLFYHGTNTATYTLKQTFGGTATETTPVYQWTGEGMDVAYFDLTNVRATHTYVITSTTISTPNHPGPPFEQVIGVTFDTDTSGADEMAIR